MATDLEKLVVQLSADIKGYEREMRKAVGVTNRQARDIENRFRKMNSSLDRIGRSAARSLVAPLAGIGAALSVREVARYADAWTQATNALAVAGVKGREQKVVLDNLYEAAQANGAPVTALIDLYGKAAQANDNLAASQEELTRFSTGVAVSLRVAGVSATQASGALTQLGQLLGSARVQAEEFNSINEGARPILMAVAEGLDAAGGSVPKLKQLVNDGEVSGCEFFQAFLRGLPQIEKMAASATTTIDQGITKVNNAFTKYIGETDSSLGASQRLVSGLSALADNFDQIADVTVKVAAIIGAGLLGRSIAGMVRNLGLGVTAAAKFATALRAATTLAGVSTAISGISVAAGPIGAVVGVAAAGALMFFAKSGEETERRIESLRGELEAMGLAAPVAAEDIEQVADAVDKIGSDDQLARIKKLRDGLDALVGQNTWREALLGDFSAMGMAIASLDLEAGRFFNGQTGEVAEAAAEIAREFKAGAISADEFAAGISALDMTGVNDNVRAIVDGLREMAPVAQAARDGLSTLDASAEVENTNAEIGRLLDELNYLGNVTGIGDAVVNEVEDIISAFEDGEISANDAADAIEALGDATPNFSGLFGQIAAAVARLGDLGRAADAARAKIAGTSQNNQIAAYTQYGESRRAGEEMVRQGREYLETLDAQNKLTQRQIDLQRIEKRLRKDAPNGALISDSEFSAAAQAELAASEARRSSSRSGGGGGKGGGSKSKKEEPGLFEDSEQDILNLQREISIMGQSTAEVAKYRAQWALLDEAKKRGIPVNDTLNAQIEAQAAQVGALTAELERGEIAQQQFEDAVDGISDAFAGAVVAGESLRDGLAQVFKQIASDILRSGISNALASQFNVRGGGSSLLGNLFGGIFGGGDMLAGALRGAGLPARANGGPVRAGQAYMVGERGPEPFIPAQNGRILSIPQAQAALRGGSGSGASGGAMNINVNVAGASGDQHIISLVHQGVSMGLQSFDRALPDRIRQVNGRPRWS